VGFLTVIVCAVWQRGGVTLPVARYCLVWLALAVFTSGSFAHQPVFNPGSPTPERAYRVLEPTISKVITSEAQGERNWHALDVQSGFRLDVALFVGANCSANFNPKLYVVGKELSGQAPFPLPSGFGALAVENTWSQYSGHGIVGRRYYLVVEHGNTSGWYFLSLGGSEVSGGTSAGRTALSRFNACR
jgi:hypothetical protein